jgi:hypothetical protein
VNAARLLNRRVDWLTVAFRVVLEPLTLQLLTERAAVAAEHTRAEVVLVDPNGHDLRFELKRTRAPERWYLENADLRVLVDVNASGRTLEPGDKPGRKWLPGWTVEIIPRMEFLSTHSLREVLDAMRTAAQAFGCLLAERLRRFDLAADFTNWTLAADHYNAMLRHGRVKMTSFDEGVPFTEGKARYLRFQAHTGRGKFSGITLGSGGPVRMRLYDKTLELEQQGTDDKRAIEHLAWSNAVGGWEPSERVTRLEFQIRGEALDELDMRDPAKLEEKADSVWQYMTQRWARLILPGTASRRSRCDLDPKWAAAQAVRFFHAATPARRIRVRSCADFGQFFGTILSHLNGDAVTWGMANEFRKCGPEKAFAQAMPEKDAAGLVRELAEQFGQWVSNALAQKWLKDPNASVEKVATLVRAYHARAAPTARPPSPATLPLAAE